jgi:membrane-bound lytic murein transglycosylase B
MITRRTLTLGLGALALAACGAPGPVGGPEVAMRAVPNPAFDAWVAGYRARAAARGIAQTTLDAAFRRAGYLPGVIERDRNQTEFSRSLEDYLSIAASDERIAMGRQMLARHAGLLSEIEARHGVEGHVVAALWGVESFYGTKRGEVPVVSALATLAFDGRRGAFFENQLTAALRILQNGDVTPQAMTGSWAGAMGHTQFIPTSYLAYAVDFRGDGRRDVWSDDPTDALASAAAYLARSGWQRGRPWGIEVRLPPGFNTGLAGRGATRGAAEWAALGVAGYGGALPDHGPASLLIPQGPAGPAFLVYRNFSAILRYNNAESYGIGVGHLSDRLVGRPPIRGAFPPDAAGMTKADRQDLQRRLTAAGFDTQGADGVIGDRTRAAIAAYERAQGLPVTGEPSLALLRRLGG